MFNVINETLGLMMVTNILMLFGVVIFAKIQIILFLPSFF